MLAVSNLTKRFDELTVFDGFDMTVHRGGFTALVGPSGCGKSTFFDVLTGVVAKDGGEISWRGEKLDNVGNNAAYMQQKDLLLPWLSLLENALLPARMSKRDGNARDKALYLFKRLELQGFEDYPPRKVSGGMRQRCALVRTLMFEHELVLLDEPLSALDAITRRSLQSLLILLQSEFQKTIVMITHDVEEALLVADEVLLLTPFPMRIFGRFTLQSPKPRKSSNPELLAMKDDILEQLQQEVTNHHAGVTPVDGGGWKQ